MNFPDVYGSGYIVKCTDLRLQYLLYTSSKDTKVRIWIGQWGGSEGTIRWTCLATAEPPQEYDLPLVEGIINIPGGYKSTYSKDQFGRVIINLFLDRADGTSFMTWHELVANLPTGYRPTQNVNVLGMAVADESSSPVGLAVLTDGALRVYPYSATETRITGTFIFQAS